MSKYGHRPHNWFEAIVNKIGGEAAAERFLQTDLKLGFERNNNDHIVLKLQGLALTGKQEIERLNAAGYSVTEWARECLESQGDDGYYARHRLLPGKSYKVALMPTREIESSVDRTIDNLRRRGIDKYAYKEPPAEIIIRIREAVWDEEMEDMTFRFIAAPHWPIRGPNDFLNREAPPNMFVVHRENRRRFITYSGNPQANVDRDGAFAFLCE